MNCLAIDDAIKVVELLNSKSKYIPGYGARCPLCGSWGILKNVKELRSGKRRYYVCSGCKFKFAASEIKQLEQGEHNR